MRPIYLISKTPFEGVIHVPILSIEFLIPKINFTEYEGIVITSKQGILALKNYAVDWNSLKCIAISESTAEYARKAGALYVEIAKGSGTSIPAVMSAEVRKGKWLYLRPKIIAAEWVDEARGLGIVIDEAIVYETSCNKEIVSYEIAKDGILIFTSPSSIRCFCVNHSIYPTHKIVVIGKTTQSALPLDIYSYLSPTPSVAAAVELARQIEAKG
ncbi:MAG: uroporphyrinogen-III synthase [Sulfuricurvum sp.]|nr:uroporphyrinogen-III synthase [Sulfuricurvum sp.]